MVGFVRRQLHMKRVGHAGTLDPCAEGVLPILVGKATSLSDLLTEKTKTYIASVELGVETDTYDATGTVLSRSDKVFTEQEVHTAAQSFLGEIQQLPPMYSAIKMGGQKLYDLARRGITVEREPRNVHIYSLRCYDFDGQQFKMEVTCSKGTYIRSLCHDLGKKLGSCAVMTGLIRTQSGPFLLTEACTPEQFAEAVEKGEAERFILPPEFVLQQYRALTVDEPTAVKIKNGLRLSCEQLKLFDAPLGEVYRIYEKEELIALLKVIESAEGKVLAIDKTFF
ncbi:MAG: tRNA pseudouridine(55) synthase TruB [Ruminococcaceae bacterium]|nr:tRNA pseudouridine(55) synthase TruB [Oscillospiraceae bacterium]